VKKVCFVAILPLILMIALASCSSTPKKQKTDSVPPKVSESKAPLETEEEPVAELPAEEQPPLAEPVPEIPEAVVETDNVKEDEKPVLAAEEPPAKVVEPESPAVAVVPEPKPEPPRAAEPPPPVSPAPRPEPPQVTSSPPAAARPAAVPPPPATPPASEEKPPVKEAPPIIMQPRDGPELSYPTPGISGQDAVLPAASPMAFSRVVRATVGQLVEIPFRGIGWVYLGEAGAQRGIIYDSRRLEPEGQSFIFRTERAGEYALKFYRQDFVRDFIMNDYVQVIVGAPAETAGTGWFSPSIDRGRIVAEPRWPSALGEAQALRADSHPAQPDASVAANPAIGSTANAPVSAAPVQPSTSLSAEQPVQPQPAEPPVSSVTPPAASSTTPPATPSAARPVTPAATPTTPAAAPATTTPAAPAATPAVPDASKNTASELPTYVDPAQYLEKAKEEFAAGRVASAISFLDRFCEHYPSGTDETWWLYGQFYEANSPSRNILSALNNYRRLVQEYPQSSRFDDARKRIAYLQRYYININ